MRLKDYFYRYMYRFYHNLCYNKRFHNCPSVRYYKKFWIHIIQKDFFELKKRYYNQNASYDEELLYIEMRKLFKNKIVIPFMDLSVTTRCTLNCRDCSQWIPYIKDKELFSGKEIITNLEYLFQFVDYIHMISPLGGEGFLNTELNKILAYLIQKSNEKKIGYIRLVTNGTIFPTKETLSYLNHPKVSILISDYGSALNERQLKNREQLIKYVKQNNLRYYVAWSNMGGGDNPQWIDMGQPKKYAKTEFELINTFETCFFANCVGLYNGGLYRCGRAYTLTKIYNNVKPRNNEVIKINKISSKIDMKKKLRQFYLIDYLRACEYCLNFENRKAIIPGIQLNSRNYKD